MKRTDLEWEWKEVIRGLDALQHVCKLPEMAAICNHALVLCNIMHSPLLGYKACGLLISD
jgi:hypothetical protein